MVESAYGDERLKRPQPLLDSAHEMRVPDSSPFARNTPKSWGGNPYPVAEEQSFTSLTNETVSGNTEIMDPSKSLKTVGRSGRPWGFDLLQKEQVGTYTPPGSDQ